MGEQQRPPFTLKALLAAIRRPVVGPLLHVRFFFGLAFATFQTIFALYAQYKLGLGADSTGYVLAYVGILSVVVQGGLIGPLTKRFRERWLIITGLWLMAFSLLAWAFVPNLIVLLIVMLPLALAGGVLGTVIQSAITKAVQPQEIGGILGIAGALESLTRVIAPIVGGYLLGNLGTWAPGIFSAFLMTWAVWFAYRRIVITKNTATPATPEATNA
jgi:DHA1 family tetracycline resistance protein-like MFS transporter